MNLELRDELAARIAAALADSTLSPRQIAIRAYATADALLLERVEPAPVELDEPAGEVDPGPSHDPRWELEPRWSVADRAGRDRGVARHDEDHRQKGPGLASTRPEEEREAETG